MKTQFIIFICAISFYATAQTDEPAKTLFGNKKLQLGYFINPACQFGNIAGSTAVLPAVGAGISINNNWYVGLNYKFIATENTPVGETDSSLYLDQKLFGIKCEYSNWSKKVAHVNVLFEAGIGETEYDLKDSYESAHSSLPKNDAWYAYLEPGVNLEINVWKYAKLNLCASYRLISSMNFRSITEKDLMGFNYAVGFKIGLF